MVDAVGLVLQLDVVGASSRRGECHSHRATVLHEHPMHIMTIGVKHLAHRPKYWKIIADNLSKAGWSWGCVSAIDYNGRTIWITDAHRGDGNRFIVRADEKLTAFLELERAVCIHLLTEQC